MEARPVTCPYIEITEEGGLMKLNLTVDIGYQKVGAKARTVLMGFNLMLDFMITAIELEKIGTSESNAYHVHPQVNIKNIKVNHENCLNAIF